MTNAAGNLVDLNGNQINGAYLTNHPGFPGFSTINASQTLAYMADLLERASRWSTGTSRTCMGTRTSPACPRAPARRTRWAAASACYIEQAQYYNQAFGTFFKRLAAAGITPKNTLFIFSSDEGDHEAGANVGRAIQPTPASCDGATVSGDTVTPDVTCSYPAGSFGELDANVTGLLATQEHNTVPFSLESRHRAGVLRDRRSGAERPLGAHAWNTASRTSPRPTRTPGPPRRSTTTSPTRPKRPSCTW